MYLDYSHNIGYGGLTFQAQTKLVSARDFIHRVVSSLFFRGCVVSSHQCHYKLQRGKKSVPELKKLVQRQHQLLLEDLKRGRFDERIAATPGTGNFAVVPKGEPKKEPTKETLITSAKRTAGDYFVSGMHALRSGDYAGACSEWLRAAALEPENKALRANLRLVEQMLAESDKPVLTLDDPPEQRQVS